MATPAVLNVNKTAADNYHIVGPLVITFAVVSLWEINRNVRWFNIATGCWLVLSAFVLKTASPVFALNIGCGLAVILFSLYKGKIKNAYGGGWRSLFQKHPLHMQAAGSGGFNTADQKNTG